MTTAPPAQVPASGLVAQVSGEALLGRLDAITTKLARIEVRVDQVPADLAALHGNLSQLTNRVRVLEGRWSFLLGVGTVVTVLLTSGIVAAILTSVHR